MSPSSASTTKAMTSFTIQATFRSIESVLLLMVVS